MQIEVVNPTTEQVIKKYSLESEELVFTKLALAKSCFKQWKNVELQKRIELFIKLADLLDERCDEYATLMAQEMGKSFEEGKVEVKKCGWMARVYAARSEEWLKPEVVRASGKENYVTFEPLGVIFSIMPWNFPFWQVLRFAVPTMMAGNVSMLKHSNQVPGCALAIEKLFLDAGFPKGSFQTVIIDHKIGEKLMASDDVMGISFTGSTEVGCRIAEVAGKNLKKVVLELGGSDPFIVFADADLKSAAEGAALGRFMNCGQSCIAAKRFIIEQSAMQEFTKYFKEALAQKSVGDPMSCAVGPIVNQKGLEEISEQVADAISKGAVVEAGGKKLEGAGFFYAPTILSNVTPQMRVISEEVFGPVAPVITFSSEEEAMELANDTPFGLGGSIWTKDIERGKRLARDLECGSVFVNSIVKSDPRMPFGGIKKSGLGRELSRFGLMEFVNVKGNNIFA